MTSLLDESKEHLEDEQLEYHHFFITEDLWHLFDRAILAGVGLVTVLILLILTIKISTNTLNILKLLEYAFYLYCGVLSLVMSIFLYSLLKHGKIIEFECKSHPDDTLQVMNFRIEDMKK